MTYSPHTWQPGEIISSARLNALEQGVAAGGGGNGSSPDIVINITGTVYDNTRSCNVVDGIELVHYDHNTFVNKILNGEPVFGYAVYLHPYVDDIDGCSNYDHIIPLQSAYLSVNTDLIDPSEDGPISDPRYCTVELWFSNVKPRISSHNVGGIYVDDLTIAIWQASDSVDQEYTFNDWFIKGSYISKYKAIS